MKATAKDIRKIQEIINNNDMNVFIGTLDGEPFLVFSSTNEEEMIQKHFKRKLWNVIEFGYDDEHTTCTGCGKIIRTSPTHYGWTPDYLITDGEIFCKDCITFDIVEGQMLNNPSRCNTIYKEDDFISHGYTKYGRVLPYGGFEYEYETGLHEGMNDDPKKVYDQLKDDYKNIIFSITEQSQFYTKWCVYVKNDEQEEK